MGLRNRSQIQRQRLAYEAARILVDQGERELGRARRKAAARAGIDDKRLWPKNEEIQAALLEQQRLFQGERRADELKSLRRQALIALETFAAFAPRLVGPVLTGSANLAQGVRLHLFADNPEDVVLALFDRSIPWQEHDELFRYGGGLRHTHPVFAFYAGETTFALVVLPLWAQSNPPLDAVSGRPERGVGATEVARLIEGPCEDP